MKAILGRQLSNGKNMGQEKETIDEYRMVALYKGELREIMVVRWYMGRSSSASVVYCSVWINSRKTAKHNNGFYTGGSGNAGGGGYCKRSSAFQYAINKADIKLFGSVYGGERDKLNKKVECSVAGVGMSAVRSTMETIAIALGYRKFTITQ